MLTSSARKRPSASSARRARETLSRPWAVETKILGAVFDPFHRAAEAARGPEQQDPFGIQTVLDTETAADIGRGDPDRIARAAEDAVGKLVADGVHAGGGYEQVEHAVTPSSDRRPRFDRCDDETVVDDFDLDDMGGDRECRLDCGPVTSLEMIRFVAGVPERRRVRGESGNGIDHAGQRRVVNGRSAPPRRARQ